MSTDVLYRVTASSLNVREAPSVKSAVLGFFQKDAVVTWISTSGDGYWLKVRKEGVQGWCSHKYLSAAGTAPASPFPWMAIAQAEVGVKEFPGDGDNPRVVEYLRSTNLGAPLSSQDETSWCSAFANWCVERAGFEGTDSAWARSWLHWGRGAGAEPPIGAIVVLERPPDPNAGHVGFLVERPNPGLPREEQVVVLLGGNQSDSVRVSSYPAQRVLDYRIPGA